MATEPTEPELVDPATGERYLYFERQQDSLCGCHALNTLLGGPYFDEVELAEVSLGGRSVIGLAHPSTYITQPYFPCQQASLTPPCPTSCPARLPTQMFHPLPSPCFPPCKQIAQSLDALERQLMAESGAEGADFLNYMAEESGNVAESGMFSIQVLEPLS
jgi:hypothetical protein